MGKEPYDPFEFAEEKIDKEYRKGFVLDTGMPQPSIEVKKKIKKGRPKEKKGKK